MKKRPTTLESSMVNFSSHHLNTIKIIIIGAAMLAIGLTCGYFLSTNRTKNTSSSSQVAPNSSAKVSLKTQNSPNQEIAVNKDINTSPLAYDGMFSYGDENEYEHTYTIYFTYYNQKQGKKETIEFMKDVSMGNVPSNIQKNGERFFFRFIGPGDGHKNYVANIRPPFNVTEFTLPFNFSTGLYATPLTWIDENRILYKQIDRNQQATFWITNINNTSQKQQITL